MAGQKNSFYITTSIAYTNANPHLGFALEVIQADVIARYYRTLNNDVFFLTGSDEHGAKIAKAAAASLKSPEIFVEEISKKFQSLKEVLNLSNDDFIRTTDRARHWPVVQKVWLELERNGDIYKKSYKGLYCVGCEAFITEKDLVSGKCRIHQKEPESVEEENYFFRLSKYQDRIKKAIEKDELLIVPETRKKEMLSFIGQGLEDVSFSRPRSDLKWGIPVPGDEKQTIYVWADALANYISALNWNDSKFLKYWPADIQCVGKDILRFHATIWPGMLLSLGLALPKTIFAHGFITSGGQKMSKSLGNVIDPFDLVEKYGTDAVRYFLLREIPSAEDGDYTRQKFEERYDADLASGLGNLVARIITLARKFKIQNSKSKIIIQNLKLVKVINETQKKCNEALKEFKFNEALISIWELIGFCDEYIEKERPWEESEKQKEVIEDLLFLIDEIAELLLPFLPGTAEKIMQTLSGQNSDSLFPRIKNSVKAIDRSI